MNEKIKYLDSIRGIACLVVVISHLTLIFYTQLHAFSYDPNIPQSDIFEFIYNSPFTFFYSGSSAVYCFFVLSGFVLARSMLRKGGGLKILISNIVKRYPRLAIPATISCIIAFICYSFPVDKTGIAASATNLGKIDLNIFEAIKSGAITAFIDGISIYNWSLWTMKIELIGSIFVYLYCFFYTKTEKMNSLFALMFILFLFSFYEIYNNTKNLGYISFFIGCFIYIYNIKINKNIAIFTFILGLYLSGIHIYSDSYAFIYKNNLIYGVNKGNIYNMFNFAGGSLIVFSIISGGLFIKALSNKYLIKLGELSFSIYLLHLPMIYLVGIGTFSTLNNSLGFWYGSLLSSLLVILVTILLSIVYSKYVDNLAIRISAYIGNKISF